MDGEERNVFPGTVADRANEAAMLPHVRSYARKMESVRALRCVNGRALPSFHAVQAYSTATLQKKRKQSHKNQRKKRAKNNNMDLKN